MGHYQFIRPGQQLTSILCRFANPFTTMTSFIVFYRFNKKKRQFYNLRLSTPLNEFLLRSSILLKKILDQIWNVRLYYFSINFMVVEQKQVRFRQTVLSVAAIRVAHGCRIASRIAALISYLRNTYFTKMIVQKTFEGIKADRRFIFINEKLKKVRVIRNNTKVIRKESKTPHIITQSYVNIFLFLF